MPPMTPSGSPLRHDFLVADEDILSFQAEGPGVWDMIWSDG